MLPKIQAVFRLTRDPELRYGQSGTAVCKVGLACSEKYGEKETQLFIDGTAFKKTAEMLNNVQKGHRVNVQGKISTESWEDQNGQKRSKTVMVIESFEFIEKRDNNQNQEQQSSQEPQHQHRDYQPQEDYRGHSGSNQQNPSYGQQKMPEPPKEIDIDEDEIPF